MFSLTEIVELITTDLPQGLKNERHAPWITRL